MKITSVRIKLLHNANKLKAFAGITFDDCFVVRNLKVVEGPHGYFVAMPNDAKREEAMQGNSDSGIRKRFDIAFPTNNETRKMIEEAVLAEYEKALNEAQSNLARPQDDLIGDNDPPSQEENQSFNNTYRERFPRQPRREYRPRLYNYGR